MGNCWVLRSSSRRTDKIRKEGITGAVKSHSSDFGSPYRCNAVTWSCSSCSSHSCRKPGPVTNAGPAQWQVVAFLVKSLDHGVFARSHWLLRGCCSLPEMRHRRTVPNAACRSWSWNSEEVRSQQVLLNWGQFCPRSRTGGPVWLWVAQVASWF